MSDVPLDAGFHWTDGWYFKRLGDGSVRVVHKGNVLATIAENEWASIVCLVSELGETGERYQLAR
jgi:hypothetical protein